MTPALFVLAILMLAAAPVAAGAQTPAAAVAETVRLEGLVRDPDGWPIPGANVRLLDAADVVVGRAATELDGTWRVAVPPSTKIATVEIAASGFATTRRAPATGAFVTVLAVASRSEQVVVTAASERAPLEVMMDAKAPRQPVPAHDGAEYLETIPGFATVRKGGSASDPVFRGMAGSRVSILSDGAAILGGCSARMDTPTSYVFPETYDVITVIKGPQTVKYGAAASAGTVLFERDRARLADSMATISASATGGAWGRSDQVFDLKAGTPLVYVRGSGSRSASNDYRDGNGDPVHSAFMRWNTDLAVGWTPRDSTRLELTATASDGRAAYADRGVDGAKFARHGFALAFEHLRPTGALGMVSASAFHNYVDHVMDNYTLRALPASGMNGMSTAPAAMNPDRTTEGGRFLTTWRAARQVTIDAGTDWQRNEHRNRSSMNQNAVPVETLARTPDARFETAGLFGEADYRPSGSTRVVSGLRVDRATGTDLRDVVALSMMSTMPNPTARTRRVNALASGFARLERQLNALPVTLSAGLGRTSRFPDYWELITKESAGSLSAFGTAPERTTQFDTGVRMARDRTTAYLAAYANRIHDFILIESNVAKASGMGTRMANITRNVNARTTGMELGITQRIGQDWLVDGSAAYVRGTNLTDDRPLAQLPPLDTKVSAQYARGRLSFAGLVRSVAAQRRVALNQGTIVGQDFAETPGFRVVSANAGWSFTTHLQLTVGVDNLLNATYAEHISRQGASIPGFATQVAQLREPGRMAWVRLNVRP